MSRRTIFIAISAVSIAVAPFALAHREAQRSPAKAADAARSPAQSLAGSGSCAGRACHGGSAPEDKLIQQNEFSTWLAHDRHARAYESLKSERGRRIGANLGVIAHEDSRCLACHVTGELAAKDTPPELLPLREEGVGCEACHGPANDPKGSWLNAHTTKAWKAGDEATRRKRFAEHSMTFLADPKVQAETCTGCHVGGPAEPERGIPALDLNHDLMAAGHPRLTFELTAYRANMPPHWRTDRDAPENEAKLWAVGQAVAARTSLGLLAYRAAQAEKGQAPWPEFCEYDCFTCHADLGNKSWRHNPDYYKGRAAGSLPYTRWYSAMLPALAPIAGGTDKAVVEAFAALEKTMSRPYPDPKKVVAEVKGALPHLDALAKAAAGATYDRKTVDALLAAVRGQKEKPATMRWEEAEQLALALAALRSGEQGPSLSDLFKSLTYPDGYESPALAHPENAKKEPGVTRRADLTRVLEELLKGG
jgi:hypothetical protein